MTETVLIIGGYGVFGGYLARRLANEGRVGVIVAGRSLGRAQAFCARHGGQPLAIDTGSAGLADSLRQIAPTIIIDASGPFQAMHAAYPVARAALEVGAHYLDLSDDARFTTGIVAFNEEARARGLTFLSGASSVPAISSAACDALTEGLWRVHLIESAILPGNRAPRGRAVMESILSQVGRRMPIWQGGESTVARAWSLSQIETLDAGPGAPKLRRRANLIGAPDLHLFPCRYRAGTVFFRAGLELGLMHHGLTFLAVLARLRLLPPPHISAPPLQWIADRLEGFGSDRGGMITRVIGQDTSGAWQERVWTLVVEAGDGPQVPATPAWICVQKLLDGQLSPGARPCLGTFDLVDLDKAFAPLTTATQLAETPFRPLFARILGPDWSALPGAIADLHGVAACRIWQGEASIRRGKSWLGRLAGWLAGFPPASERVPVRVEMRRTRSGETWIRRFGKASFRSHLSDRGKDTPHLVERFGAMRFRIDLTWQDGRLHYPVVSGSILGVQLPHALCPVSKTFEYVDAHGRPCFDVAIRLPLAGEVVHYSGWLEEHPADDAQRAEPEP